MQSEVKNSGYPIRQYTGWIFLSFLLLQSFSAFSQGSYIFHHIMQSDGLLHTNIRTIMQDRKGYMWILSQNGLQRYDGARFVNYAYDISNPAGIMDIRTASLFSDKANNCLWIIDKEVEKLDLQTNRFSSYPISQLARNPDFRFSSYTDSLNNEWLLGKFGVLCNRPFKYMNTAYISPFSLAQHRNDILAADSLRRQTWMINYFQGLFLFDEKSKKVYTHDYNPIHHPLLEQFNKTQLISIMKDGDDNLWISTNTTAFYRYNATSGRLYSYSLENISSLKKETAPNMTRFIECILEDDHHALWLGTANAGLLKYDREHDRFIQITDEEKIQKGLFYNYDIQSIFQDRDENIWLSTDKGISIFNPYRQLFTVVRHEENNSQSLPKEEIQSFIQTKNGNILVGTWGGGITVYDSSWNFKKTIRFQGPFEYNLIWSFMQNDDGTIWIGCQHGYIHIYDPATEKIKTIHPPELNNFTIHCLAKDAEGNIWFGLHDGKIAEWKKSENRFYPFKNSTAKIDPLFNGAVNIFFDSQQRCWVSTELGLKEFDTKDRSYRADYLPEPKKATVSSANSIQGVAEYNDSVLLVGSAHGGLYFFNKNSKTFQHITTPSEVSFNTVSAINKDGQGNYFISTDYAIYKFDKNKNKFFRYQIAPGILNSSFSKLNFYQLQNGRWLTATATDLVSFSPNGINEKNEVKSNVEITGFKIFDSSIYLNSAAAQQPQVKLDYRQNFLTVEFSTLHFTNRQTNYYYKLSGVNGDWVNAGPKQFASYTNMQPGEYVFSVKAENGGQSTGITSFKIIITPPFWKTWWFIALVILMLAATVFLLVRRRILAIKRQAELKQKLADTEMTALRSQMNPHFIFNCLNAIDNLIQTNQPDKATTYLARFAKLMRYLLESSKHNLIPFEKDFAGLQLYLQLEQFRAGNKFTYSVKADKELLEGDYKVPPLIIQPFVENAIQHGLLNKERGDRNLEIKALLQNNYILYVITDNGVGRIKALEIKNRNKPEHKSYGTDISSERVQLHNQNGLDGVVIHDIESGSETGTEVRVKLKI